MEDNSVQSSTFHFDFVAFSKLCLKNWKWFVIIGFVFALFGAFDYLTNKPYHEISASVMLPTSNSSSNMVLDIAKTFSIGDIFGASSSTENESMVLGSYEQFLRTTKKLGLNVSYSYKGMLTWKDEHLNPPIKVEFAQSIADTLTVPHFFEFKKKSNGKFDIEIELMKEDYEFEDKALPCTIKLPTGEFTFTTTEAMKTKKMSKASKFRVFIFSYNDAAQSLAKNVEVTIPSKKADFLALSYLTHEPEYGILLLNTVIESYNDMADSQKEQRNNRTLQMVDERLAGLSTELRNSETQIETFKKQNNLTDIEGDAQLMLQQAGTYENSLLLAQTENSIIKNTRDFINNPNNRYQLIPALSSSVNGGNSSGASGAAGSAIDEYNQLVLERMKMMTSAKNNNATLRLIDEQLDALLANIKESVERAYVNSNIALKDIRKKAGSTKSVINSYPTLEREFLGMKRDQLVQEQLYLFLLQQREEAQISLSTATLSCVTIDPPHVMYLPVGLGPIKRVFVFGVLGLIIAAMLIFALKYIKAGFFNLKSLKAVATVPVLGEISGSPDAMKPNTSEKTAKTVADIIFTLDQIKGKRVLVTAPAPGQGSNFTALSLATYMTEIGKKVLLVDADYHCDFSTESRVTLVDYVDGYVSPGAVVKPEFMGVTDLYGIPSGETSNPSRVLSSDKMKQLMTDLTPSYDYIVISGSEVGNYSETYALAPLVDLTIFTLRTGVATRGDVKAVNDLAADGRFPNIAIVATEK